MNLYHGSPIEISAISDRGTFGGVFASAAAASAKAHGDMLYTITPHCALTDYALNYEIEGAWEAALALCNGDEDIAERIMSADCVPADDSDAENGWELQRLRGQLAARLGFDAVEMNDEHGTTWLCLPGCKIDLA